MRPVNTFVWLIMYLFLLVTFACVSAPSNPAPSREQPFSASASKNEISALPVNSDPPRADSLFSDLHNQMTPAELRERLEEVKSIEREARVIATLRHNGTLDAAECMRTMERLQPRAEAIRDEYKRMLSEAECLRPLTPHKG